MLKPFFVGRPVHVFCEERMGDGDVELGVRPGGDPQQLQGAATDHEDGGGGEAVQAALRGAWRLAQTKHLLDDPGEFTIEECKNLLRRF